ncbi:hypothetical protein ACDX78_02825 [Virgibacillus oceani]
MERKLKDLEKRTEQLEKKEKAVHVKLQALQSEIDMIMKKDKQAVTGEKVNHLTEINEEMFRQNVRLRELIENCIAQNEIPTQKKYYEALLEAHENS